MPDINIISMSEKTTPQDNDLIILEDAYVTPRKTKKITWANFIKPFKDLIGNMATLKTTHKNTVVGSNNELWDKIEAVEANNSLQVLPYQSSGNLNDIIRTNTPPSGRLQFSISNVSGLPSGVSGGFVVCLRDTTLSSIIIVQLYQTSGSTPVIYGRSTASGINWIA